MTSNVITMTNDGLEIMNNTHRLSISNDVDLSLSDNHYDTIFEEMIKRMSYRPMMKHQCNGCGGSLELNADKHIFSCPYCGSTYAIGTINLN